MITRKKKEFVVCEGVITGEGGTEMRKRMKNGMMKREERVVVDQTNEGNDKFVVSGRGPSALRNKRVQMELDDISTIL